LGTLVANAGTIFADACRGEVHDASMRNNRERIAEALKNISDEEQVGTLPAAIKRSSLEAMQDMTGKMLDVPGLPGYKEAYRDLIREVRRVVHFDEFDRLYSNNWTLAFSSGIGQHFLNLPPQLRRN
jgi:hypothetical protein